MDKAKEDGLDQSPDKATVTVLNIEQRRLSLVERLEKTDPAEGHSALRLR